MSERRFPPPWTVEKIPGGFRVLDANGQSLAYVYSRETKDAANIAGVLTEDEARRIAANIAKLDGYRLEETRNVFFHPTRRTDLSSWNPLDRVARQGASGQVFYGWSGTLMH